ncbi:MAG: YceI family protein [Hyphomicrobiaceae bacterium]
MQGDLQDPLIDRYQIRNGTWTVAQQRTFAIVIVALLCISEGARSETFSVNASDSRSLIEFRIRQFGIFSISGRFERFRGKLTLDGRRAMASQVRIDIDAASVNSSFPARDRYLRGKAVLASRNYPKITFRSTSTKVTGRYSVLVTGKMTFREITRPVSFHVRYVVGTNRNGRGSRKHFIGSGSFKLSDFGVTGIPTLLSDRVFLTFRLALRPT